MLILRVVCHYPTLAPALAMHARCVPKNAATASGATTNVCTTPSLVAEARISDLARVSGRAKSVLRTALNRHHRRKGDDPSMNRPPTIPPPPRPLHLRLRLRPPTPSIILHLNLEVPRLLLLANIQVYQLLLLTPHPRLLLSQGHQGLSLRFRYRFSNLF